MKTIKFTSVALTGVLLATSACKYDNGNEPKSPEKTESTPTETVTDACNNTYPVVNIGDQCWMAENMACIKYDNESEAYKAGFLQITTSENKTYNPYYSDGRQTIIKYSKNLTEEQRRHLGLLYNWAAAMGYKDEFEAQSQIGDYSGKRQGICPNGWHIPSKTEWNTLCNTIAKTYDNGRINNVGTHMKTTIGWYDGDSNYIEGDNISGFSVLPAGFAVGNSIGGVGNGARIWSSTVSGRSSAYCRNLSYGYSRLDGGKYVRSSAWSVRCLKD